MNLWPTNCRSCHKQIEKPRVYCNQCEAIKHCTNCIECQKDLVTEKDHCMYAPKLCWKCAEEKLRKIETKERSGGLPIKKRTNLWERFLIKDPLIDHQLKRARVTEED